MQVVALKGVSEWQTGGILVCCDGADEYPGPTNEVDTAWLEMLASPTVRPGDWETAVPDGVLYDAISSTPLERVSDDELLAALVGLERIQARLAAVQARVSTAFAERRARDGTQATKFAGEEIAAALKLAPRTGVRRLNRALELTRRLPITTARMEIGAVSLAQARVLAGETRHLDSKTVRELEGPLLEHADGATPGELGRAAKKVILQADADSAARREARARETRRVLIRALPDGMAEFVAVLPAADGTGLYTRLTDLAQQAKRERTQDDRRSMTQLRADALTDLVWGNAGPAGQPLAQVVLTDATLMGAADTVGELDRYGPITAPTARRIATDAVWQALRTDSKGTPRGAGRRRHRPSAALTALIKARDRTCRWPGCSHPAWDADVDHTRRFPDGPTAANNLAVLCRHHQRVKTHGENTPAGWTVHQGRDAILRWTSPTGRQYTTHPWRFDAGGPRATGLPESSPEDPAPRGECRLGRRRDRPPQL